MNDKTNKQPQKLPLSEIRTEISQLDSDLLKLFARRRELSLSVALNKEATLKPIRDQEREKELLELLVDKGAKSGLDAHYVTKLFHAIIEDSLAVQRDYLQSQSNPDSPTQVIKTIAVLGGKGAYSYLAACKHFNASQNTYLGCSTFDKVLKSVEQGKADFGVIPIENTTSGGITEVYDLLLDSKLTIVGEEKYPIKHCLVTNPNTEISNIRKIHAHPEASRQCNKNLPKLVAAEVSLVSSTAEALQLAKKDTSGMVAAIASQQSAEQFGLTVLLKDVANLRENTTRFLVVAREAKKVSRQVTCKTSIAISTGQKPGSLAEVLLVFRDANIPLSKLESRPIAGKPWEQMFYVDLEGNIEAPNVEKALEDISRLCRFMKVLGSYATEDVNATKVSTEALSRTKATSLNQQSLNSKNTPKLADLKTPSTRKSYHLASRDHKMEDSVIEVKGVKIGGNNFTVIAGPCAVESKQQIEQCAKLANETGVSVLRGGCFKPRTSPYSFQGLGFEGLNLLNNAGDHYHLPIITEVMNTEDVREIAEQADMLQIGARNMQNFSLLKSVGQINRPVMLKRGLMASIEELLNAAEYILAQGNMQVFLCERGIRTFETATRNTLDLSAVPLLKQMTHLPIIVDPSHAVGKRELVEPLAKAAKAVGAHGVMIEFHPDPESALSDGPQALKPDQFAHLMHELHS
ncbi:MAG: bifunctional 3-deoxy-7-phosphoheptulonate synthase/chorismate mutase [Kangiellaceae bacterium]|nr:bifunctional 3-deoxy-7-phosphoheptulonate synthase/chorismate mutase [Kangiellaceae bacterium]MCW9017585.1 bifunctional 3-deoxy-7-phosphoheptulonate synthase/chorismate mutase [Kangiellaceae bacterium]